MAQRNRSWLRILQTLMLLPLLGLQCTPSLGALRKTQPEREPHLALVYYSERHQPNAPFFGGLYLMDLETKEERYLTPGIDVWREDSDFSYCAKGKLLFSAGTSYEDSELYSVDWHGNVTQLTDNQVEDIWGKCAPDGQSIAFYSRQLEDGVLDLYLMNAEGSDIRRMLDDESATGIEFAWSPDSQKIAVTTLPLEPVDSDFEDLDSGSLRILDVKERKTILSLEDGRKRSYLDWSSDGRKLAYVSDPVMYQDVPLYTKLWTLDVVTGEERLVAELEAMIDPRWAPHEDVLAFSAGTFGEKDETNIYLVNADASGLRQLAKGGLLAVGPWSPAGTKLAITSVGARSDDASEIWIIDVETGAREQITDNDVVDTAPVWVDLDE